MFKKYATISLLIWSLLLSMTEINKVFLLGFTVLHNNEKAAHFCTCSGCNHGEGENEKTSMCSTNMIAGHTGNHSDQDAAEHCSVDRSGDETSDKVMICGCDSNQDQNLPVLYNTLDKVALLFPSHFLIPADQENAIFTRPKAHQFIFQKEIFHPPRA